MVHCLSYFFSHTFVGNSVSPTYFHYTRDVNKNSNKHVDVVQIQSNYMLTYDVSTYLRMILKRS